MRIFVVLAALAICAQADDLRAPSAGVVLAGNPLQPRELVGIPGAWLVGSALSPGTARAFSKSGYSINESASGLSVVRFNGASNNLPVSASPLVVVSPNGTAAAIYDADSKSIVVLRGLPDAPRESSRLALQTGAPRSIAIADDGVTLLFADSDGRPWTWAGGDSPATIPGSSKASVVRFMPGGSSAMIYDGSQLVLLDDVTTGTVRLTIPTDANVIDITISAGGEFALTNAGNSATLLNLRDGTATTKDVQGVTKAVVPFSSGFALSVAGQTGVWVFMPGIEPSYIPSIDFD